MNEADQLTRLLRRNSAEGIVYLMRLVAAHEGELVDHAVGMVMADPRPWLTMQENWTPRGLDAQALDFLARVFVMCVFRSKSEPQDGGA